MLTSLLEFSRRLVRWTWRIVLVAALGISALTAKHGVAGPTVHVGTVTSADQRVSVDQLDHGAWNQLLSKYVDADGNVDYQSWKSNASDVTALERYLDGLSAARTRQDASVNGRLAYWINAYNSLTIYGILREYPTTSIRNHTARIFGYNIWKDLKLRVGNGEFSLEAIEHQVLRKMNEPRIHFAIVCASRSCPRLLNQAYTPEQVQLQLEANAKDFFSRQQNFRFDERNRRFHLSAILKWFAEDFGRNQTEVLRRITPWLPTQDARTAAPQVSVRYLDYDWSLNEVK